MGYALPVLPLWKAVGECAIYAAFRDPRFSPLIAEELDAVVAKALEAARHRSEELGNLLGGQP